MRILLALLVVPALLSAQTAPRPEDVATLDGIIKAYYDVVSGPVGSLVDVWSTYESARTPGGAVFSRGINSIQLYWDGKRWWILGWTFDDERHGNRVPAEYLPRK